MSLRDLSKEPARTITKEMQLISKRQKLTQKQLGDISANVRAEVHARSGGICEVKRLCTGAVAVEQAHLKGRRIIERKTSAADLRAACKACHDWLDKEPLGIQHKRTLREEAK
jgi:hypothetical protein